MSALPLDGRRILVTRAARQAGKLSSALRTLGAEPVEVPVLEIQPPASFAALDQALRAFRQFDWAIFTSANTVHAIAGRAAVLKLHLSEAGAPRVAAVGAATAESVRGLGLTVSFLPDSYVAESLLRGLGTRLAGLRVLLARAEVARDLIPDTLRELGAKVEVIDAYRNGLPAEAPGLLRKALASPIDAATFTSSSTATHLAEAATKAGIAFPFAGVPAISIGPVTSETLRELGWPPAAEADPHDVPGLIAAVGELLRPSA